MHIDRSLSRVDLDSVIAGLLGDLKALRAGKISVADARVRAELGRVAMRGFGLAIQARKFLADNAKPVPELGGADVQAPKRGRRRGAPL